MKKDWFEIFKAGKHTDSKGQVRNWTEEDLDNIVAKYNADQHTAPIVIGHPDTNSPAWGWIKAIRRVGDVLQALPSEIVSEFEEWFDKGLYKKRSISLYPDGSLRHVGFLGAMPPAVKGLKDIEFKEGEEEVTYEFSENWRINIVGKVFQRLRDWLIEKHGTETADKIFNQYEIDDLKAFVPDPEPIQSSFNEDFSQNKLKDDEMDANLKKELDELKVQVTNFQTQLTAKDTEITTLKNENATLKTQIADSEKKTRQADFEAFCEGLIKDGKLTPANKPMILQQLEAAHQSGQEISFSENGQEKKVSAVDNLKKILSASPKTMDFNEFATKDRAADPQNADFSDPGIIAQEATKYKNEQEKSGVIVSYSEAVNHVVAAKRKK